MALGTSLMRIIAQRRHTALSQKACCFSCTFVQGHIRSPKVGFCVSGLSASAAFSTVTAHAAGGVVLGVLCV